MLIDDYRDIVGSQLLFKAMSLARTRRLVNSEPWQRPHFASFAGFESPRRMIASLRSAAVSVILLLDCGRNIPER